MGQIEDVKSTPGDKIIIGGVGAYCSAMPAAGYNSRDIAPEYLLNKDTELKLIRRAKTWKEINDEINVV